MAWSLSQIIVEPRPRKCYYFASFGNETDYEGENVLLGHLCAGKFTCAERIELWGPHLASTKQIPFVRGTCPPLLTAMKTALQRLQQANRPGTQPSGPAPSGRCGHEETAARLESAIIEAGEANG